MQEQSVLSIILEIVNTNWPAFLCLLVIQGMSVALALVLARRNNRSLWLWGPLTLIFGIWAIIVLLLLLPSQSYPYDTPKDPGRRRKPQ
jgi:hypothetical protein